MRSSTQLVAIAVIGFSATFAQAQSAADAQSLLKSLVSQAKAKGAVKFAEDVNAGTDANKCKEAPGMNCLIANTDLLMMANAKNAKVVGTTFSTDLADMDGKPVAELVFGPMKAGKTTWDAQYKFAVPGTKKIALQHAFCEKVDAKSFTCAVLMTAPQ